MESEQKKKMSDILIKGVKIPKSKPISLFLLPNGIVFCDGVCLAQKFAVFSEQDKFCFKL